MSISSSSLRIERSGSHDDFFQCYRQLSLSEPRGRHCAYLRVTQRFTSYERTRSIMTDEGPKRKRPCIETEHGRRGGRAGADGRKIEKPFGASGFRIYKLWDEKTKKWIACEETTKRRKVDSYIYRYDRMKGFILPETSQQLLEMMRL